MPKSTRRPYVPLTFAITLLLAAPSAALSSSPQELFERAETLYRQLEVVDPSGEAASWTRVTDAFADVATRYPDSPLASEALWRMSWIYGRQGRAGDPASSARQLELYRELIQSYPTSPHAPEALLRLAVDAEAEGGARAALLYSRVLQEYPSTPQASLARNRMAEVIRANPDADPAKVRRAEAPGPPAPRVPEPERRPAAPAPGSEAEQPRPSPGSDVAGDLAVLAGVRYYSDRTHTRIVLDLDRPVAYQTGEAHAPERLFVDLRGVGRPEDLPGARPSGLEQVIAVDGNAVSRVRVAMNQPGIVRVVVDLRRMSKYTMFTLDKANEPFRIVIDVPTATVASRLRDERRPAEPEGGSITEQLGLGVHRVVIDPGHGGTDPGAIGRTGATEKELTLALSRALATRLRESGYEVILTRDEDRTVSLQERTEFANSVDADLFVSMHVNSARNRKLRGFETYYLNLANDPTAAEAAARENAAEQRGSMGDLQETLELIVSNEYQGASGELAASIQDSLVMHVSKNYQNVHDLGVKTAPFFVLVGAEMPGILIEASFVSNEQEETWLKSSDYRVQVAEAIEIGLQSYVDKRRVTAQRGR